MSGIETTPVGGTIRLGQFLKYAALAESGAQVHELVATGLVRVDGEVAPT